MEGSVDMEENNENEWEFMEGNAPAPLTEPEEASERFRRKIVVRLTIDRSPGEQLETMKQELEETVRDLEEDRDDLFTEQKDVEDVGGGRDNEKVDIVRQMRETEVELAEADAKLHLVIQALGCLERGEELPENFVVE